MGLHRTIASAHVGPAFGGCSRAALVIALFLLGGFAAFGVTDADAASGKTDLTISPAPGTPDVNPQTQISVLGVKPQQIKSVAVTGAASGPHPGSLHSYTGNRGASFVLDQPLAEGETVAATVSIKGRKPIDFDFTVADLGPTQPPLTLRSTQPDKLQHFVSEPGLTPPLINVNHNSARARRAGEILLTPLPSPVVHPGSETTVTIKPVGPGGPMLLDERGRTLWFDQLEAPNVAANLRVQRYRGKRVLTWWRGSVTPSAFGLGEGVIADHRYRELATVRAGNGYPMDIHEFTLAPNGDALFTIYSPIRIHLPGTPEGELQPLLDAIVQQVDVKTGLVVWEWHSYGHIPLSESQATPENSASYDAFHINSIQALAGDKVLISARDTSAIYKLDRSTGRIVWRLGGSASDFKLGKGARFYFQHDAQLIGNGLVSMFDDEAGPPQFAPSSRGLVLRLRRHPHKATVVKSYHRQADTSAQSEGSLQTLSDGSAFVGWGAQPFFSQFSPRGRLLFDANLPEDDGSYRVYRFPWKATPQTPPRLAAVRAGESTLSLYASWNGATEVDRWRVMAGSPGSMAPLTTVPWRGLETRIDVAPGAAAVKVQALDDEGKRLATSNTVSP